MRSILLLALLLLISGCVSAPPPEEGMLFPPPGLAQIEWRTVASGVEYARNPATRFIPKLHLLRIDLENDAVLVAPFPPQEHGLEAHKIAETQQMAFESVAEPGGGGSEIVAVVSATPFRYKFSLRSGFLMDPVGLYKVNGTLYSQQVKEWGVLWLDYRNELHITDGLQDPAKALWAAGGFEPILIDGANVGIHGRRNARTAVGLSRNGRFMYMVVVEDKKISRRGLTSKETAAVIARLGAYHAMNFDGGNSAFLLLRSGGGTYEYVYRGDRHVMACFLLVRSSLTR